METIEVVGFIGALLIGIVLGLMGGGGSILTVPVLVYILAIEPITATAYSLFVVGVSALVATIRNAQKNRVDFKTGIVFAIPALVAVFLTRKIVVPNIPLEIHLGEFILERDTAIMMFFALIMLAASISMIRGRKEVELDETQQVIYNYPLILIEGLVVGFLTGIVGAGGGFLIIPALVLFAKLPMKKAVATSLMIIAIKSLLGFMGDVQNIDIEWTFLLSFTSLSVIGIFIGIYFAKFIDAVSLKKGFGWFVLAMGVFILLRETLFSV